MRIILGIPKHHSDYKNAVEIDGVKGHLRSIEDKSKTFVYMISHTK